MRLYLCAVVLLFSTNLVRGQCSVAPIAHDDTSNAHSETVVVDVLANDQAAGQALTVAIFSNTCGVPALVDSFGLVELQLSPQQPIVNDCSLTYRVTNHDGQTAFATISVNHITEIFKDGFEIGNTSKWSETTQ